MPAIPVGRTMADLTFASAVDLAERIRAGDLSPVDMDLYDVAGLPTTQGSRLFADDVAETDAPVVQRLKAARAIVLGKTNTPQFGHPGATSVLRPDPDGEATRRLLAPDADV